MTLYGSLKNLTLQPSSFSNHVNTSIHIDSGSVISVDQSGNNTESIQSFQSFLEAISKFFGFAYEKYNYN
ncbi:hypothetical protein PPL_01330 [Heterostelium album PN500]|uniref:Uncharacterized protein n=1 Tax=Heterostelium pallidum (strain ATCC 26659 / Pp 5 / PN500) TaxID=670386 RepID=D3AYR6_HETP5|nr:hypothetical protein PPL_01330 [Heterostelium album PN500]EFA86093.1 hypothetical protein PPL_01330 [Heterostelium album PN500]|eukprot:XP_020438199.1 hypothetical protein PPL_01330 [Heterostelium album PN500]